MSSPRFAGNPDDPRLRRDMARRAQERASTDEPLTSKSIRSTGDFAKVNDSGELVTNMVPYRPDVDPGTATLPDMINSYNALLRDLRDAGLMEV
jgi:hypothetical protein